MYTHTQKAIILLSHRWYAYKKIKFHYFLFDFCYFTNFLTLVYIWIPSFTVDESYRGELFTTCFSFAMGPLVSAIVLWRNSLVPHSTDKMTSLFIHISPSLTLWGIRWYVLIASYPALFPAFQCCTLKRLFSVQH